jgi:hypothetical protein
LVAGQVHVVYLAPPHPFQGCPGLGLELKRDNLALLKATMSLEEVGQLYGKNELRIPVFHLKNVKQDLVFGEPYQ